MRVIGAITASLVLIATMPSPTLAGVSLPGPCSSGTPGYISWGTITASDSDHPPTYPINGAIGYIAHAPAALEPCTGGTTGVSYILPANIDGSGHIVQEGLRQIAGESAPIFVWTPSDGSGGVTAQATWFTQQHPVLNDEYFFMIYNQPDTVHNSHYWTYCIEDVSQRLEKCTNSADSTWTGGGEYWSGGEVHNTYDVLGRLVSDPIVQIFDPEYRKTDSANWYYMTEAEVVCDVFSAYPYPNPAPAPTYYGCASQDFGSYPGFYPFTLASTDSPVLRRNTIAPSPLPIVSQP